MTKTPPSKRRKVRAKARRILKRDFAAGDTYMMTTSDMPRFNRLLKQAAQ